MKKIEFTEKAKKAFLASYQQWVDHDGEDFMGQEYRCALCPLYHNNERGCSKECPVFQYTGVAHCDDNPSTISYVYPKNQRRYVLQLARKIAKAGGIKL